MKKGLLSTFLTYNNIAAKFFFLLSSFPRNDKAHRETVGIYTGYLSFFQTFPFFQTFYILF